MRRLLLLGILLAVAVPADAARLPIVAGQDIWPVYAPDGRHVAFTVAFNRSFALKVVDAQTLRVATIGSGLGQLNPSWSSDSRIAWSSGGVLYTAKANGTARRRYLAPQPSYSPAWRPRSSQLAYLTHKGADNLDLWVAGSLWAKDAIGSPAWSPDGSKLAFQREDGIWVTTGPSAEVKVVGTTPEPGPPAWSPDGTRIAYNLAGSIYAVVPAGGTPKRIANAAITGPFSWSPASDAVAFTSRAGLQIAYLDGKQSVLARTAGSGASFAPTDPHGRVLAYSSPVVRCPGHVGIAIWQQTQIAGSCTIAGTSGNDVIQGTQSFNDVILGGAGNDQIHAGDRHTDRIDCGPGRDTVWADKTDHLIRCEIIHR